MAMNKQRKTSNLLNILSYDDAGNIVLRDYSQTIRYNWNGTIHAFTGPLSISSIAAAVTDTDRFLVSDGGVLKYRTGAEVLSDIGAFVLPSLTSGSVLFSNGTTIAQNNANFFWDAANGRLGIGTNAPAARLQVTSDIIVNGVNIGLGGGSQTNNTRVGNLALNNNNLGNANSAFGDRALQNNANGYYNVAIGDRALRLNTQEFSVNNTAIGSQALEYSTSGRSNTAVGQQSMLITNGLYNTAIGDQSGYFGVNANTGGSNNIFIGYQSVGVSATESNRTWIGNSSTTSTWLGGNLLLGGTTNSGQRLQVQGDAFIKGSGATAATTALSVQNSAGTNLLRVRNDGFTFLSVGLITYGVVGDDVNVGTNFYSFNTNAGVPDVSQRNLAFYSRSTSYAGGCFAFAANPLSATSGVNNYVELVNGFVPTSGTATLSLLHMRWSINQTGGANGITRGLYVNPVLTAAADWRSIEWSNNSGWGLYGAGTANNYLGGRLAIGTTTTSTGILSIGANLTGGTTQRIAYIQTTIQSDVTGTAYGIQSAIGTAGTSFTLSDLLHYQSSQASFGGGSVVTSQYGFAVSNNLIGATNNYGFFGNIPNGTNRWNLYMAGTADNYLAGKLLINTTTVGTFNLDVNGTARVSGASTFGNRLTLNGVGTSEIYTSDASGLYLTAATNGGMYLASESRFLFRKATSPFTEYMRVESTGNLLVGTTTDQGYRVQITSASADSQLNVWGATAPSIRLDNAASGATQRFVIGLATATNNFIQGANAGDVCMTPGTSSALVFGMWQTSSSSEVMRISTSSNVLIGTSTDVGAKLRVVGDISASVDLRLTRTGTSPAIILDQTQLRLVNQTSGFTIGLNVENDIIRFGGAIRTTPPAGSGNPEYKLGSYSATAPTATGYLNIEVGGVVYKVLAST